MKKQHNIKQYRYLILFFSIVIIAILTYCIGKPMLSFVSQPEAFPAWIQSKGIWGALAFMGLNILQVLLAIIPGGPFEIGAGYAFGVLKGSILCDIAMTIGGVIIFLFVRKFGITFVELFTTREKIESVKFLKATNKSVSLLFLFFLLPGTPKDLMCYVVGLSNIQLSTWILINLVGRFPAILLSALSGSALGEQKYEIFIVAMGIIVVFYFIGMFLYNKYNKSK
ncbi:MAG: TVP38/TMEM64 family protein [Lachnospiraceae bacterium]|nr:TVP38/TMEM64 family protein [Lachnospiraceae bacterium]